MKLGLLKIEEIIGGFFLVATVILVVVNAILRKLFGISLSWAFEAASIFFVWSIFIGASAAYKHKMHIGIDLFIQLLPVSVRRFVIPIIHLTMIVIIGYIFYLSLSFVFGTTKKTPVMGLSAAWVSASIMIGFFLMLLTSFRFFYQSLRDIFHPNTQTDSQAE